MRSFITAVSFLAVSLGLVGSARAEGFVRLRLMNPDQAGLSATPDLMGYLANRLQPGSRFGWFALMATTPTWAEGYVGPTMDVTPWLNLYVGFGVQQQGTDRWREQFGSGAFVTLPGSLGYAWVFTEFDRRFLSDGTSLAFWYEGGVMGNLSEYASFGLYALRYYGVGPRLEVRTKVLEKATLMLGWLPVNPEYQQTGTTLVAQARSYVGLRYDL